MGKAIKTDAGSNRKVLPAILRTQVATVRVILDE
jgi:hypothetical protein